MKLKNKITVYFLGIILLVLIPLTIFYTQRIIKSSKQQFLLKADSYNQQSALMINGYFSQFVEKARTQDAVSEIRAASAKGKEVSKQSEDTVKELVDQLNELVQGVAQIATDGDDIKESIHQIEIAVNALSSISQQNTTISDMLAENSVKLFESANVLNNTVQEFKTK